MVRSAWRRAYRTYEEWLKTVPAEITDDPLWKMEVCGYKMSEEHAEYLIDGDAVLSDVPLQ